MGCVVFIMKSKENAMITFAEIDQIDLKNKNVVVTGANSGIGFEASKHFAKKNAKVFMCVRDVHKGEAAKNKILDEYPQAQLEVMMLDLGELKLISEFAKEFIAKNVMIDILLNNAGVMAIPYLKTVDGFERQIGVNHLGHYYLTSRLINCINDHGRIVNVSSMAYLQGDIDMNNFMFEDGSYTPFKSYARSKLANLLFTLGLVDYLKEDKRNIVVTAAHPGIAKTGLFDKEKQRSLPAKFVRSFPGIIPTAYEGAKSIITACVDLEAQNGNFYGPYKQFKNKGEIIQLETLNDKARNLTYRKFLWEYSLDKTNADFLF